ncbi:cell division protein SepF [Ornithinibacillus halophilus]|uniref:Cell division protein SepF n=1 Tax=Ornithinibacillus halophilus TaxID=930117 RepID=A0A1M5C4V0_9BACI|nr:cell division protein SepF [Ornithinibacillus halophilus]SHF49778.1 cell division inhibitor SepF [Ornithinibacillus halophilus]
MSIKNKLKTLFSVEDEYEYIEEELEVTEPTKKQEKKKGNVVNLTSIEKSSSKVVLCEPRSFGEVQEIADHIVNRRAVVINLQRIEHYEAIKIVDFLSGTIYAVNGNMQKLGSQTFLCAPDNVDVSGTISEAYIDDEDYSKGW